MGIEQQSPFPNKRNLSGSGRMRGLVFIKHTDLNYALNKLGWKADNSGGIYKEPASQAKCQVCGEPLAMDNIGAFTPEGAVCNDFACVMGVLLKEKKENLEGKP